MPYPFRNRKSKMAESNKNIISFDPTNSPSNAVD